MSPRIDALSEALPRENGWPFVAPDTTPLPPTMPNGEPWPRISVITPSFNYGKYIEQTILSVLNQGYPNVEHIIFDGGSSDDTVAILDRYRDRLAYAASEPDRGQSHAINKGMGRATGKILTYLNSDDMLAPGALAAVALAFATSGADFVAGICELYRDGVLVHRHLTACDDGPLPIEDILDLDNGWNAGQFFYQPEVFFSRAVWERAGGQVAEHLYYSMDYDMWLRFAEIGARLHVIGRSLAWFRVHEEQKTHVASRFKAELVAHRDDYLARTGRTLRSARSAPNHNRRLRMALLNDFGWEWGAGIAHRRFAEALQLGGHTVEAIALSDAKAISGRRRPLSSDEILDRLSAAAPDIVLVGNVHGANLPPITMSRIARRWPTFCVLHDLWWLTGRCVYTASCAKHLTGCDATCPTPTEYPALAPEKIAEAWSDKRLVLSAEHAPVLLAQSRWTFEVAREAFAGAKEPRIDQISIGLETDIFRPRDRQACRERLGLPLDRFVVVFAAVSLRDARKGGDQIIALIDRVKLPDILFVAIGHHGFREAATMKDRVEFLGYRQDPEYMAQLYAAADVVVAPSLEETFGQVFVEAAACGTPVIGHGVTGVADALRDGVTGLATEAPTVDGLERALLKLYDSPDLRFALGRWGRIYAECEWSLEKCYQKFFVMLRRQGVIDRFAMAHWAPLATHRKQAPLVDDLGWLCADWEALEGIGLIEEPAPELGIYLRYNWCVGPVASVQMTCVHSGRYLLVINCQNRLFDRQCFDLAVQGVIVKRFELKQIDIYPYSVVWAEFDLNAGPVKFSLFFDRWLEPTAAEPRKLALLLHNCHLIPL